jgi:hypothetical protein
MRRALVDAGLAALLAFPMYLGLANTPTVNDWFLYGSGWATFHPLFVVGHAIGIQSNPAMLIAAMFALSFIVALTGVRLARAAIRKMRG